MTFEEAKKRIADCVKLCTDDYNRYEDEFMRGESAAYKNALAILKRVNEPVGNPDKLTLKELARELRKLFRFKYLTVSPDSCGCPSLIYCWNIRPAYRAEGRMWLTSMEGAPTIVTHLEAWHLEMDLDLSEYRDENGNVDYSKCIVEVE